MRTEKYFHPGFETPFNTRPIKDSISLNSITHKFEIRLMHLSEKIQRPFWKKLLQIKTPLELHPARCSDDLDFWLYEGSNNSDYKPYGPLQRQELIDQSLHWLILGSYLKPTFKIHPNGHQLSGTCRRNWSLIESIQCRLLSSRKSHCHLWHQFGSIFGAWTEWSIFSVSDLVQLVSHSMGHMLSIVPKMGMKC